MSHQSDFVTMDTKLFNTEIEFYDESLLTVKEEPSSATYIQNDDENEIDHELTRLMLLSKRKDSLKEAIIDRQEFTYAADETFQINSSSDVNLTEPPKTFKCAQCPQKYLRLSSLSKHMSLKGHGNQEKAYLCIICSKSFVRLHSLTRHVDTFHHKLKPGGHRPRLKCDHCTRSFVCSLSLSRHLRRHTDGKYFKCQLCGLGFCASWYLGIHMEKVHLVPPV